MRYVEGIVLPVHVRMYYMYDLQWAVVILLLDLVDLASTAVDARALHHCMDGDALAMRE